MLSDIEPAKIQALAFIKGVTTHLQWISRSFFLYLRLLYWLSILLVKISKTQYCSLLLIAFSYSRFLIIFIVAANKFLFFWLFAKFILINACFHQSLFLFHQSLFLSVFSLFYLFSVMFMDFIMETRYVIKTLFKNKLRNFSEGLSPH